MQIRKVLFSIFFEAAAASAWVHPVPLPSLGDVAAVSMRSSVDLPSPVSSAHPRRTFFRK